MPVSLRRSNVALRVICRRVICSTVALGSICCMSSNIASAQAPAPAPVVAAPVAEKPPKEMLQGVKADGTPIDLTPHRNKPLNRMWSIVGPMFNDTNPPSPQSLDNLDTFTVLRLAEMTWPAVNPNEIKEQPEGRRKYLKFNELLKAAGADESRPQLHDRINAVILANLPAMINDKEYSLTARYNAMLLLGQLDQIEYDGPKQRAAVPLAAAEPLLIAASQASALPEVLRVGAFVGLARHAELAMPPNNRGAVAAEALKMLAAAAPPQGISETGLQWIRKLSLQIVMGLSQKGSEVNRPEYVAAIVKILENEKQPLFLRRDAALTLGYLDPGTISAGSKPEVVVKGMTSLTLAVMRAGMSRENPSAPADLTKGEDVLQTPTDATRKNFAESVSYYLNCIAMGLGGRTDTKGNPINKGLKVSAAPTNTQVTKLLKSIDDIVVLISKSTTRADEMTSKLASEHQALEKWAGDNNLLAAPAAAVPAAAAAPGPAAGGAPAPAPGGARPGAGQIFPAAPGTVFGAPPRGN
jgi:hypothetical protein